MKIILLTPPVSVSNEHEALREFLLIGVDVLHIRKPSFSMNEMRSYLKFLPQDYLDRVSLHSHHVLADEFGIQRLHYPSQQRQELLKGGPPPKGYRCSTSVHTLGELHRVAERFQYVLISPVYSSVSKPGYLSSFDLEELSAAVCAVNTNVIALGGVRPDRFSELKQAGFAGGAVLGAVWRAQDKTAALRALKVAARRSGLGETVEGESWQLTQPKLSGPARSV